MTDRQPPANARIATPATDAERAPRAIRIVDLKELQARQAGTIVDHLGIEFLEIAPDIEIKVAKRAIADRVYRATPGSDKGKAAATPASPVVPEPYEDPDDDLDL